MKKMPIIRQSIEERRNMILNGSIVKTLIFLSVPTVLMAIVQSLVPVFDSLFLNRTSGPVVAAAVGFVTPVINVINGMSMGLGAAGMAMIGNANGRGDMPKVKHLATQLSVIGFTAGVLVAPLCAISALILFKTVNSDIAGEVLIYMLLYSFVMPFLFLTAIFNAIKNAMGQPEATLYRMIILMVLKIIFNTIYLYIFSLKTVGAVAGSFSSYFCVGVWMYFDLFGSKKKDGLTLKGFKLDREVLADIFRIGVPSMLNSMTVSLGFILINMEVQKYGAEILNAETVASNLSNICFILPSSLSTTVTTMVSMNMGRAETKRAKHSFYMACVMSLLMSLALMLSFMPLSSKILLLFLKDKDMIKIAQDAIGIYILSIYGFSLYMMGQGVFIGLGRTKIPLVTGLLRIWLLRYIFILIFEKTMGVYSVFWGNLFSNTVAGLLCTFFATRIRWEVGFHVKERRRGA